MTDRTRDATGEGRPPAAQRAPRGPRTRGRELALKYLYAADIAGKEHVESFDRFVVHQNERGLVADFARRLVQGALPVRDSLDMLISELASNWSLDRMAVVDRNILRLGCYELLHERETPPGVVINEAVELAKRYGTAQSGAFVNGILDRVRQRRDNEPAPPEGSASSHQPPPRER